MFIPIASGLVVITIGISIYLCSNKESTPEQSEPKKQGNKGSKAEEVVQLEEPLSAKAQKKAEKKKKKKAENEAKQTVEVKPPKQLQQIYSDNYYGTISLRSSKHISSVTCLTVKNSKILVGNSRNQLVLFDLRKWKSHTPCSQHFFTSLDNNAATAVAISSNYYFAALDFEKTIAYFQFKGGQGGVYFKEVKKFRRNIFKGNQGSLYVPQSQKFIVSTGVEADTSINVWSMTGEKLTSISTYQIEHYNVDYGADLILIRGWTSEVKSFHLTTEKDGSFLKLQKSFHLTLSQKPMASVIDNIGSHALTITGDGQQIKFWLLNPNISSHPTETTIESCQIGLNQAKYCSIATLKGDNQRLKTILIVADDSKIVVLDREMKVVKEFEGVSVESLHSFGASKSAVVGTFSGGKLSVWDFTKLALEQTEYVKS